jgi:hypothetical protein
MSCYIIALRVYRRERSGMGVVQDGEEKRKVMYEVKNRTRFASPHFTKSRASPTGFLLLTPLVCFGAVRIQNCLHIVSSAPTFLSINLCICYMALYPVPASFPLIYEAQAEAAFLPSGPTEHSKSCSSPCSISNICTLALSPYLWTRDPRSRGTRLTQPWIQISLPAPQAVLTA